NISAALSAAESVDANGRELIAAIALAYEVQCRLCDAASIRARGWDHVTYGAFSTALACARLMKLDPKKTRHAVNIAGVACAAMRQSRAGELSHWKGVAVADAARRGVYSALLARVGMTGPAPIFEGQMAFEKQLGVSLGNVGEKFKGAPEMILNTSIKFWPAEYHSQSAIEAAVSLRKEIGDPAKVKSMTIESHDASVDIIGSEPEKWKPATRETADHSLPYITAIALIDGEVTDKQFDRERFSHPNVWKFLENVKVQRNSELSSMYPGAVANIVHVDLADGRRLTRRVDYPLGHAKNRLKDSEVEEKFRVLVEPMLGNDRAGKIIDVAWKLDEAANVDELMKALLMPEIVRLAAYIANSVAIPAIVDADTGFGGAENVARTICELEKAGLAGCHIEDQEFPKRCGHLAGKSVVDVDEMVGRIKAAVSARSDEDFMIIARTDARAVEDFDSAVERSRRYLKAGADAIFPEALQSADESKGFVREAKAQLLATMTEVGKSPLLSFEELAGFGYKMVIFPQSAFRVSMKASE